MHLNEDLEPYQCIELECQKADTTFSRLRDLRLHYQWEHPYAHIMLAHTYTCLFCEDDLPLPCESRFKHLGRHLEDLVYSVIPRQQETWQFYSDSTSDDETKNPLAYQD